MPELATPAAPAAQICAKCRESLLFPNIFKYFDELKAYHPDIRPLPGVIAGIMWPEYDTHYATNKRSILLATSKPGQRGTPPSGYVWICNVLVDPDNEAEAVTRLQAAVESSDVMVGWYLVDMDGGAYPTTSKCKKAWLPNLKEQRNA